jgi:DNA-binding MarR family transcriptional regulator
MGERLGVEVLGEGHAIRIILFLYRHPEGGAPLLEIGESLRINHQTVKNTVMRLQDLNLLVQVEERRGVRRSKAFVQRLTVEGKKVAEILEELEEFLVKHGASPVVIPFPSNKSKS